MIKKCHMLVWVHSGNQSYHPLDSSKENAKMSVGGGFILLNHAHLCYVPRQV